MSLKNIPISENLFEVTFDQSDLIVSKKEIELTLGYIDGSIPSFFNDMIEEILSQIHKKTSIKTGYGIFDFKYDQNQKDNVEIGGTLFHTDKIITGQIRESERIVLFISTIGREMESWANEVINSGDPAFGYIADTTASIIVETVADKLHEYIGYQMKVMGLNITNRYSPGYCNWPVSDQHKLFSKFPQNFCGISLTDSALMLPKKSITGLIGVGNSVKYREYLCDRCGVKDCTYKSKRSSKRISKMNKA